MSSRTAPSRRPRVNHTGVSSRCLRRERTTWRVRKTRSPTHCSRHSTHGRVMEFRVIRRRGSLPPHAIVFWITRGISRCEGKARAPWKSSRTSSMRPRTPTHHCPTNVSSCCSSARILPSIRTCIHRSCCKPCWVSMRSRSDGPSSSRQRQWASGSYASKPRFDGRELPSRFRLQTRFRNAWKRC
jgi:hypothetical protein